MPLAYAIAQLQDGQSARRPNMGGRIDKSVTNATTGAFTLTYRKKDGTTTYVYTWDGEGWEAPQTTIPVDAEWHAMMLAQDWQIVETADIVSATW